MSTEIHLTASAPPETGGFNGKHVWQVRSTGALYKWSVAEGKYEPAAGEGGGAGAFPATATAGALPVYDEAGDPAVLAAGDNDQVLTLIDGEPAWADAPGAGGSLPSGTAPNQVAVTNLSQNAAWSAAPVQPEQSAIFVLTKEMNTAPIPAWLHVGSYEQVLSVDWDGNPAWRTVSEQMEQVQSIHLTDPNTPLANDLMDVAPKSGFGLGSISGPITSQYRGEAVSDPQNKVGVIVPYDSSFDFRTPRYQFGSLSGYTILLGTTQQANSPLSATGLLLSVVNTGSEASSQSFAEARSFELSMYVDAMLEVEEGDIEIEAATYAYDSGTERIFAILHNTGSDDYYLLHITGPAGGFVDALSNGVPPVVQLIQRITFAPSMPDDSGGSPEYMAGDGLIYNTNAGGANARANVFVASNISKTASDIVVGRLDDDADFTWKVRLTRTGTDHQLVRLIPLSDGDILVVTKGSVVRLDKDDGTIVWQQGYSSPSTFVITTASSPYSSTNCMIGGVVTVNGNPTPSIVSIDPSNGNVNWARTYKDNAEELYGPPDLPMYGGAPYLTFMNHVNAKATRMPVSNNGNLNDAIAVFELYDPSSNWYLQMPDGGRAMSSHQAENSGRLSVFPIMNSGTVGVMYVEVTSTTEAGRSLFDLPDSEQAGVDVTLLTSADFDITSPTINTASPAFTHDAAYADLNLVLGSSLTPTRDYAFFEGGPSGYDGTWLPGPVVMRKRQAVNGFSLNITTPLVEVGEGSGWETPDRAFIIDEDGSWHLGNFLDDYPTTAGTAGQVLTSQGPGEQPIWSDAGAAQYVEVSVGQEGTSLAEAFNDAPSSHVVYSAQGFDVVAGANSSTTGGIPGVTFEEIVAGEWTGGTLMTLADANVYSCMFDVLLDIGYLPASKSHVEFGFGLWLPGDDPTLATTYPIFWAAAHGMYLADNRIRISRTETLRLSAGSYVLGIGYGGLPVTGIPGGEDETLMRKRTFRLTKY